MNRWDAVASQTDREYPATERCRAIDTGMLPTGKQADPLVTAASRNAAAAAAVKATEGNPRKDGT